MKKNLQRQPSPETGRADNQFRPGTPAARSPFSEYWAAGWIIAVAVCWFFYHPAAPGGSRPSLIQSGLLTEPAVLLRALVPLAGTGLITLFLWLACSKEKQWSLVLSPGRICLLTVLGSLAIFNLFAFLPGLYNPAGSFAGLIPLPHFLQANGHFLFHLLRLAAWLAVWLATAHAAGSLVTAPFRIQPEGSLAQFLFHTGLGLWLISVLIFVLAALGWYTWWTLAAVALTVLLIRRRQTAGLIRQCRESRWMVQVRFTDPRCLFFLLLATLVALNLADIVRPIPIGWDDLDKYLNKSRLVAARGELVPGLFMFPVELLQSASFTFLEPAELALAQAWASGILSALLIYAFGRRFWKSSTGLAAAAVWYAMPMVGHLAAVDVKTDLTLFFIAGLALWAFFEWSETPGRTGWLCLSGMLAGIAWTFKITTVFLLAGLAAGFLYQWQRRSMPWRHTGKTILAASALALLPFLPWLGYNLASRGWQMPSSFEDWTTSRNNGGLVADDDLWRRLEIDPAKIVNTVWQEEVERYTGSQSGWWRYFRLPWDLTMNTFVNGNYVVIGFLFLALVPLYFLLETWRALTPATKLLAVFAGACWAAWLAGGRGIPWYGLAGFLPLALLCALLLDSPGNRRWFRRTLAAVTAVALAALFLLHSSRGGRPESIGYAAGLLDTDGYTDALFPRYREIAGIIAGHPPSAGKPARVYRIGTMLPYFIKDNDRRLFDDSYLDFFWNLQRGQNDATIMDRFRKLGFSYVIFDLNILKADGDHPQTLHRKAVRFMDFAHRNLKPIVFHRDTALVFFSLE